MADKTDKSDADGRAARLAEALRANLRRRKEQVRSRSGESVGAVGTDPKRDDESAKN